MMEPPTSPSPNVVHGSQRLLGLVESGVPGPLLVVVGALHGNEPAGVLALEGLFELLAAQQALQCGTVLGLIGNLAAFRQNHRYLRDDLNRHFTESRMSRLEAAHGVVHTHEDAEALGLLLAIKTQIAQTACTELIFLDIHTTTADGGDFITATHDAASLVLAKALGPPVVLGLTDVLIGTLAAFMTPQITGVLTRAFAYEAGQHVAPSSAQDTLTLLCRLLEHLEMIAAGALGPALPPSEFRMVQLVERPALSQIRFRLAIPPGSNFVMLPGFRNFDPVQAGQVLAYLDGETVVCDEDGFMLMPLYQTQGNDGYFLVRQLDAA